MTSTIDLTKTILTLIPSETFIGFTANLYAINCSQTLTNGNKISINVIWKDGTYTLQTTANNITISHTNINNVTTNITGNLTNKNYNTPGYLG
jgi:hypothetical protein